MIQRKTAKPPHLFCIYLLQLPLRAVISTVISTLSTVFIKYPYLKEGWVSVQGLFITHCLVRAPAP